MSNSSRIEAATRQHVGATLTGTQIVELVKISDPNWKGGVYPSDAAYRREGTTLVPRGKVAYGDGVLEYLAENSFKVLPTDQIVRRPSSKKTAVAAPAHVAPAQEEGKKKAAATPSKPPVATKSRANLAKAVQ
jgi:hypothetical protein